MIERYGVDSYSKTDEFKIKIDSKMSQTIEKIKMTFLEKYGSEYLSKTEYWKYIFKSKLQETIRKCKSTCLDRYGVDNVSKVNYIQNKIKLTKELNGTIISDEESDEWYKYKKIVRCVTNSYKKILYENWNGCDYYDDELIRGYLSHTHTHRFYPTIDHKTSVYYGFKNSIDANIIGSIDNLCITKRFINSTKSKMIESEFLNYKK